MKNQICEICGEELANVIDVIILEQSSGSTINNVGRYCSRQCMLVDINSNFGFVSDVVESSEKINSFYNNEYFVLFLNKTAALAEPELFSPMIPRNLISSQEVGDALTRFMQESNQSVVSKRDKQKMLCYWISCFESLSNLSCDDIKSLTFPQDISNGALIPMGDTNIIVADGETLDSFLVKVGNNDSQTIYLDHIKFTALDHETVNSL